MPDNQVKTNKYLNTSETLDLRENVQEDAVVDSKKIELPPLPEALETTEHIIESLEDKLDKHSSGPEQADPGNIVATSQARQRQEQRCREIENVLADGLDEFYLGMDQVSQDRFKKSGEEAGRAIDDLLAKGRCTAKKIVEIIKRWLSLIPGVNRFFLEQEAKIKADRIITLQRKYG